MSSRVDRDNKVMDSQAGALHFIDVVAILTRRSEAAGWTVDDMFRNLTEEVGELAAAISIERGVKKKPLDEPAGSEALDCVITALSIYFALGGSLTHLVQRGDVKCAKWVENIVSSEGR